ncbi:hypothetical protein LX15_004787 [Streptoalloteichus tenebrarius]|uniref:Uncharacterized protein n=1 Tax=Streptoalloteichus tenebrarius (strain ATCC 17920 / DSM 40477 / JCM 4838 / CBS 697.72 / NBRC 16177 / NCIMB 11028 / NRRL B-12390 / A12253. 1 / ISP 5477) TaxID=1933 RepID=A0ABT1HZV3_STRSD|nr:hypothetical protein [Streptoalloteichus tenebrarius]MCP2261067.1 hypothetical protein [Streptoalloteichus tenebrarius]BFF03137.1 hypothetical protein GCM10020241_48120 [Streptoalloteichus tenebrarius]
MIDPQNTTASSPPVVARVSRYELSCLPDDHPARDRYTLAVEYRGKSRQRHDEWAVLHGPWALSRDGHWDYEPPSTCRRTVIAQYRYTLDDALEAARREAPRLAADGCAVADVLRAAAVTDHPSGCRWCGVPHREHSQRWTPETGWHEWTAPTMSQIKTRMLARRHHHEETQ